MSCQILCTFSSRCQSQLASITDDVCRTYILDVCNTKVNNGEATLMQPDSILAGAPRFPAPGAKYSLVVGIPVSISREFESIALVMDKMPVEWGFQHMVVKKCHIRRRKRAGK